jgi:peptidoglycan/xylan/chitin deacetylase (PgdA/CDA1 family)
MQNVKEAIKNFIGFGLRFSGLFLLLGEIIIRRKVTIAVYHNPAPEVFRRHMEFLARRYTFITMDRLVQAIRTRSVDALPPRSLVVTLDDGFKENFALLEVFKTHRIRPSIFLCSHMVATHRHLWFSLDLPDVSRLKRLPNAERSRSLKRIGYYPQKEFDNRQLLSLEEIRQMAPYVDFQSHSRCHPILIACGEAECRDEFVQSKSRLEELLSQKIRHFAYPNGDYRKREMDIARQSGYESARCLDLGWNDADTDPYRLKAMGIQDDASINILCGQISGLFNYFRFLRHGSYTGRHPDYL